MKISERISLLKLCKCSIIVFVLILYFSEVSFGDSVIRKCCFHESTSNNSGIENVSENVIISINLNLVNHTNNDLRKNITVNATKCHKHEDKLTETISFSPTNQNGFYDNGFLLYLNDYFSPNQYCVEKSESDTNTVFVKVQPSESCDDENCLKKCCDPFEVYDLSTYGKSKLICVPSFDNPWDPVVYPVGSGGTKKRFSETPLKLVSDHPRNWCTGNVVIWSMRTLGNDKKYLFRIKQDGTVLKRDGFEWKSMNTSRICLDGAINFSNGDDDNITTQRAFSGNEFDTIILECEPTLAKEKDDHPTILYGIALAVSSVFLLFTIIIYGMLWDKQNIHGLTLLGYVTTMFLFYISLIITYFHLYTYPAADFTNAFDVITSFCGIIAVISHFLYISTTCWMTVISFDIFAKFRILKLTRARSKSLLKFVIYFLFATLVPMIIVCTGVILDILYGDELEVNVIIPRYGWNKCFLDLKTAAIPYLFGPIGFFLILNCVLYIATIFYMYRLQESTKFASAGASNTQIQKQRAKIRLYSKLFLLMGISWIFEFISFLIFGSDANILVIVGDMINILQPIAVFIIFVCKREILQSLCKKHSTLAKIFSSFEIEEFTPSTSSNGAPSGKLTRIWNPVASTKWFRSRINSTQTDTSNISNQSIRSTLNVIEEAPLPPTSPSPELSSKSPLNHDPSDRNV